MKMEVVIFDLDDTLYKEIDYLKSAYMEISAYLENKYSLSNVYSFMINTYKEGKNVFDELIKNWDLPEIKYKLLDLYRNHKPNLIMDKYTKIYLEKLSHDTETILGMITDGRSVTQRNKIVALNLFDYIDNANILISEEVGFEKPNEELFKYFTQKYCAAHYSYIGDNILKDFVTPNRMGWETICLIDNGNNIHKQNFDIEDCYIPHKKIYSFKELIL